MWKLRAAVVALISLATASVAWYFLVPKTVEWHRANQSDIMAVDADGGVAWRCERPGKLSFGVITFAAAASQTYYAKFGAQYTVSTTVDFGDESRLAAICEPASVAYENVYCISTAPAVKQLFIDAIRSRYGVRVRIAVDGRTTYSAFFASANLPNQLRALAMDCGARL